MAFDFNRAPFFDSTLSSRDLNTFLKMWKEGRTHRKMERCCFYWETSALNMIDVLEGLWSSLEDINALNSDGKAFKIGGVNRKSATLQLEKGQGSVNLELNVNR
ncbi:hypothetical protein GCK72_001577 [Caenorhabditis remanei]|uniref:Sdz-33 F-box domain-containing protein n=1 Tax=Caenorhabditis remanei TaxID=31234 RepID=A0A6A5HNC8_CAERE|nr:hypothetical protein GCK72_001577 [Caenorhabditis remanei]KAF1769760.1 hypothetical protein GCK72_001577 [Caenorhabditis remanei]